MIIDDWEVTRKTCIYFIEMEIELPDYLEITKVLYSPNSETGDVEINPKNFSFTEKEEDSLWEYAESREQYYG